MLYVFSAYILFFKQKTAYEMRISDGSSDVCSSDLLVPVNVAVRDRFLSDMRRTVHHIGQDQPMPVHSSRFGQPVGHVDSHPIAFAKAQRRVWHLAIEGISVDVDVWQYLPADHRCLQIEHQIGRAHV